MMMSPDLCHSLRPRCTTRALNVLRSINLDARSPWTGATSSIPSDAQIKPVARCVHLLRVWHACDVACAKACESVDVQGFVC